MTRTRSTLAAAAVLLAAWAAVPAVAQPQQPAGVSQLTPQAQRAAERRACATLAARAPEEAIGRALAWERNGGADDARYCRAMAEFHRGRFADAAAMLEGLADTLGRGVPELRAGLLARAGWSRFRTGDAERAERLYGEALALAPEDAELWTDRAMIRASAERWWDALADLDRAVALAPDRPGPLVQRARVHRALALEDNALRDVEAALRLSPGDADALLLRGNARLRLGDTRGAQADWESAARAAPGTASGDAAADNLRRLRDALATAPGRPAGR
jgi:tetratricopeptide (TPR) repeat protein